MRIVRLVLAGALLALPALAERGGFLPVEKIEQAVRLLPVGTHFRRFCAPCGDLAFSDEPVITVRMHTEGPGRSVLVLNGNRVEPFDIFLPEGARWTSVGQRLGLRDKDSPGELGARPAEQRLWELAGYWVGTIGASLKVQLQLSPSGRLLAGTYFYERVGEPLLLSATRLSFTAGGNGAELTLSEQPEVGFPTGTLRGRLDPVRGSLTGVWTAAAGGRKLPFSLRRLAKYVQVEDHTDLWHAEGRYPVFERPLASELTTLNALLAGRARAFQREAASGLPDIERPEFSLGDFQPFVESIELTVTYVRPGIVSLRESMYGYTGGAHGNSGGSGMTYAVRDGVPIQLTLADVLRPGAEIRERLVGAARAGAGKEIPDFSARIESQLRTERFDSFLVSPRGVSLLVEIGGTWGPFEIPLPRAEISGLLRPDGPLGFLIDQPPARATPKDRAAPAGGPGAKPPGPRHRRPGSPPPSFPPAAPGAAAEIRAAG